MPHLTTKQKPGSQGSAGGDLVGGYLDAVELCREILQRSEEGEYYLPEDLVERIREV
jgi:hypothetical protein